MQAPGPEGSDRRKRGAPCFLRPFCELCKRSFTTFAQHPSSLWKYQSVYLHRRLRAQPPELDIYNKNNIQVTTASLCLCFLFAKLDTLVGVIERLTNGKEIFGTVSTTGIFILWLLPNRGNWELLVKHDSSFLTKYLKWDTKYLIWNRRFFSWHQLIVKQK